VSDEKPVAGFVPLKSVTRGGGASNPSAKPGGADPRAALAEIRQIYFRTSRRTIDNDFMHAIELLKALPDEETRQKAHVYMEGLAEMRKEWAPTPKAQGVKRKRSKT
jgi:hypothetical protein